MISCTLNGHKYTVDFVSGRALREIDDATQKYLELTRISSMALKGEDVSGETLTVRETMDAMVKWFCVLFGNQFTPDDMYDYYPADRIIHDISTALLAVQNSTTEILDSFPTVPTPGEKNRSRIAR